MFNLHDNLRSVCISHIKDVDGCVCAALVFRLLGGRFVLVNYGNLQQELKKIRRNTELLYICDLGLNETVLEDLRRIREFAEVVYIDHHPMDEELREELVNLGVELVHDTRECAGVLTYHKFREALPWKAGLLAAYAAISDNTESGPLAQELLSHFDRQLILFESMLLSHALERAKEVSFKRFVVSKLAEMEYPHRIKGVSELALEGIERSVALLETLPSKVKKVGRVGYVEMEGSSGTVASLIITACDVDVGISYKCLPEKNVCDISIRGAADLELDLSKLASRIARSVGGFGGGHPKASGARVPSDGIQRFVEEFIAKVNSSN